MTSWGAAWSVLVLTTCWLLGLGVVRLLASRQVSTLDEAQAQRKLAQLTLSLACVSTLALVIVSWVIAVG